MKIIPHLSVDDLKDRRTKETKEHKKWKWHALYLWMKWWFTKKQLANIVDKHYETIKKLLASYNIKWSSSIETQPWKWWDRRNKKIERKKEKELMDWFISDAIKWKFNTIKWIEQEYKEKINPNLWKWVIFAILERFERTKKVPRTYLGLSHRYWKLYHYQYQFSYFSS